MAYKGVKSTQMQEVDIVQLKNYENKVNILMTLFWFLGAGSAVYLAYRNKKGIWGYIGYFIVGIVVAYIVGSQVASIAIKKPEIFTPTTNV